MKTPQTPAPWSQHGSQPAQPAIKITVNDREWTYTQAEAEDAVLWLLEDSHYLENQAKIYYQKGMPWIAEQSNANAKHSRETAENISAAILKAIS